MTSLPCSPTAERLVLGLALVDESYWAQVASVGIDGFSLNRNQQIYRRMADIASRGERIDRVTVAMELHKHGELGSDGLTYLNGLDEGCPQIPNLDSYVRVLRDKSALRTIALNAQLLQDRACQADAEPAELIRDFGSRMSAISTAQPGDEIETPYEIFESEIARIGIDGLLGGVKGIMTPLPTLNNLIVGMQKGDFILIGARPSVGKTAWMCQMARHAASKGHGGIIFSLEMGKLALSMRMACSASRVDSQLVRLGVLTPSEKSRLMGAVEDMRALPLWIDKKARTVPEMHAKVRRARVKRQIDWVMVDYIQLMSGNGENQNAKVSEISRGLKLMAEEFEIPVVALSQLSRPPKGQNPEPGLPDLRDSGSLEQDGDVVMFLHAPGGLGTGMRRFIVAKQRNGPVDSFNVNFNGQMQVFEELEDGQ